MGVLLTLALGIAVSPVSIIAVILLLTSNRSPAKGLAYLVGWLTGLIGLSIVMLLAVGNWYGNQWRTTVQFTSWLMLIAGIVLLLMAYTQWRQRSPQDAELTSLRWLRVLPKAQPPMALSAGLFFGLYSVKNLLIMGAAAVIIGEAGLGARGQITTILIFVAIATVGIAAPIFVLLSQDERARTILTHWEYQLSTYNVPITCIVLVIIALEFLSIGLSRLS